jgi:methylthioribose-1-phosphate isomerase
VSESDGQETAVPPADAGSTGTADLARRRFFRDFAGELMRTAATVAGAASAIQRSSAEAAGVILNPSSVAGADVLETANPVPGSAAGFRTAFRMDGERLILVDQRRLPERLTEVECRTAADVTVALRDMVVRGAPAMGQAAALGLALTAALLRDKTPFMRKAMLRAAANGLVEARPTAANVRWAVSRLMARFDALGEAPDDGYVVADVLRQEADAIVFEAAADHERLARFALDLLPAPADRPLRILTHCNTGPLACGQFGTALGVVQLAVHLGGQVEVFIDETRPYLQGSRLTAWELAQAGIPHTLIADSAAGWLLAGGSVDAVLVGADRVAANGDTANKIGTYPLAVLAQRHTVPFYVCAPLSSVDLSTPDGASIPIEQRPAEELTRVGGVSVAPLGTVVLNPAFDVTPAELITAIVTEEGALRPPYGPALTAAAAAGPARKTHPPAHAGLLHDDALAASR